MFDISLGERTSLPAPANRRFWAIGVTASVAAHAVLVAILVFGAIRDGDPVARRRSAGEVALASQITLLDLAEPARPSLAPAPASRPSAGAGQPAAAPVAVASTAPALAAVRQLSATPGGAPAVAANVSAVQAAAGASPAVDMAGLGSDYRSRLLEHIAAHRRPPPPGTAPGAVYVNFSVERSGAVGTVTIVVSSGEAALDRAAIDAVQDADPMPAIPPGFPDRLSVMVPIDFRRDATMKTASRP